MTPFMNIATKILHVLLPQDLQFKSPLFFEKVEKISHFCPVFEISLLFPVQRKQNGKEKKVLHATTAFVNCSKLDKQPPWKNRSPSSPPLSWNIRLFIRCEVS